MSNQSFDPIYWTRILVALAIIIQAAELLTIRRTFSDRGVWRWSDLRGDFSDLPQALRRVADLILSYNVFVALLWLQLVAAILSLFVSSALLVVFLFVVTMAVAIRWRGTFNGGSDYMAVVVLSALLVVTVFPDRPLVVLGAVYYIALQSCLSYFISGVVKLRSKSWRHGNSLLAFLQSGPFEIPTLLRRYLNIPEVTFVLSWTIISFECLFPLTLVSPNLALPLLMCGIGFHLANSYLLGLNRFFFIWIATYPALLWCSSLG